MKKFHQNLLMALALGLCALCVWQWQGETRQRLQTESLAQNLQEKLLAIQSYTNSIKLMDTQVAQMDARIAELKATIKTNDQMIIGQKLDLNKMEADNGSLTNELQSYKYTVELLTNRLNEVSEGVKKQNEAIKEVVAQRDGYVQQLNDSVKERNDIVAKYNELVVQVQKLQSAGKEPAK